MKKNKKWHPDLKDLDLVETTWNLIKNQWIKRMVYNIKEGGGGMSLTNKDKEWIVSAIVEGVKEGVKPLSEKIDAVEIKLIEKIDANTKLIKENHDLIRKYHPE